MNSKRSATSAAAKWLGGAIGLATASYAAYIAITWCRYGKRKGLVDNLRDTLLDEFMPDYEVVERHQVKVAAPAAITWSAAAEMDFDQSAVVRGIFKGRQLILGGKPDHSARPRGLVERMKTIGWGVLAEIPGREIVMGAVTKPWVANPVFRAVPAEEFASFCEPSYVKIIWTLRANPVAHEASVFYTETRAAATDFAARRKFRWYWSMLSPGIIAIRSLMVRVVKREAERRCGAEAGRLLLTN